MPYTDDKIYGPYEIDKVVITGEDLKKRRLLAISSEVYYYNTTLWREALRYMQKVGDRKAEQQIFMKRVSYANSQAAKGIFIGMGLTVGAVAAVGVGAVASAYPLAQAIALKTFEFARPAWKFYKATTYWRMGINAGVQTMIEGDAREVNYASVAAEILPLSVFSPLVEWRPFSKWENRRLRTSFVQNSFSIHYKSIPETMFDVTTQVATCGLSKGISLGIRGATASELQDKLIRRLFENVTFPIYQSGFQLGSQTAAEQIRKDLKLNIPK